MPDDIDGATDYFVGLSFNEVDGWLSMRVVLDGPSARSGLTTSGSTPAPSESNSSGSTRSSATFSGSMTSETSAPDLPDVEPDAPGREAGQRVVVVAVPPVKAGGILVANVPRTYSPTDFDRIRDTIEGVAEDMGVSVVFLPEGVSLASLSPEELWRMGLGVINKGQADEGEVELPDDGLDT